MVYGFVKQSGGHIKIYSEVGSGTTIRLYLPRSTATAGLSHVSQEKRHAEPLTGNERILVVEDDLDVLAFTTATLRRYGHQVTAATDASEALRRIHDEDRFDLLFTDVVLADGMNGRELANLAVKGNPSLR